MKYICEFCEVEFFDKSSKKRSFCSTKCSVRSDKISIRINKLTNNSIDNILNHKNKMKKEVSCKTCNKLFMTNSEKQSEYCSRYCFYQKNIDNSIQNKAIDAILNRKR